MFQYKYTSYLDKIFLILGTIFSIFTGICNSLAMVTFGRVVGVIISYANAVNGTSTQAEKEKPEHDLMQGIAIFIVENCGIGIGSFSMGYLASLLFNYSALKQVYRIRLLYLRKMLNQDIAWHDTNHTADFASRMTIDINKIEEGYGENISFFIVITSQWISFLCIALILGWELFLTCMIPIPFGVIVMVLCIWASSRFHKREMEAYGEADAVAGEAFVAIKTVVAFGGQHVERQRYERFLMEAKRNSIKRSLVSSISNFLVFLSMFLTLSLSFWYCSQFFTRDEILLQAHGYTPTTIITIFLCVTRAVYTFGISLPFLDIIAHARGAVQKVFSVIDSTPTINLSKGKGKKLEKIEGNLTFQNVHFSYPSRPDVQVLKGLNVKIKAGETVALVANSGCGKSTCIQLIQRFYDPNFGEICIDGHNLKELDLTWFRKHIGVVSQEPVLFEATIAENIKLGCQNATQEDIEKAAKKSYAHDFINSLPLSYNTLVGERGVQLSGGQKQRIAIARALIRKPAILLLDEATSALDATGEALVQTAMDLPSIECTTIIIAHRLSTIWKASRILVMADGTIQEDGTHSSLMERRGTYYHLVSSQIQSEEPVILQGLSDSHVNAAEVNNIANGTTEKAIVQLETKTETSSISSLWYILKINNPELCYIILGCMSSVIIGASTPIYATVLGGIIGTFIADGESDFQFRSAKYAIFFFALSFIRTAAAGIQLYSFSVAGEMLSMRLRGRMFTAILNQEVGWFDKKENGVGSLCAQLSGETANVQGAASMYVGMTLNALSTVCFGLSISFYFEWRLTLATICFSSVILIACYYHQKYASKESKSNYEALKRSSKLATEAIANIRTVASLCCETNFFKLFQSALMPYYTITHKNIYIRGLVSEIPKNFRHFAYAAALYYGVILIRDSGLPPSSVIAVCETLILSSWNLGSALQFLPNIKKGIVSAHRIFKLLMADKLKYVPENYNKIWDHGNIKFEQVHFSYPTRPSVEVLSDVDLAALQDKTVALVGPSGCGKSTIMQLLLRFYEPTRGKITVDEQNIKTIDKQHLRPHLGLVSQEPSLFNRTIAENIAYGDNNRDVTRDETISAAMRANIHNFISSLPLGYDTNLGDKGMQLSGGQKQRIAIARALIRNPKVLLLDEATSALDAKSEKVVQDALNEAKLGRSCIIIAHRLSTIQDADVIYAINHGKIVELGSHSELMARKGFYYSLYSLQGGSN